MREGYRIEDDPHSRASIERTVEYQRSALMNSVGTIFNLNRTKWDEKGWPTDTTATLKSEELDECKLFFDYASKRLIRAGLHAPFFPEFQRICGPLLTRLRNKKMTTSS